MNKTHFVLISNQTTIMNQQHSSSDLEVCPLDQLN